MALTTTAKVKAYLGITDSSEDTLIDDWILAAQAQIERYCNRVFDSASFTEYFDGNLKQSVVVRNPPVTTLTSVSYRKDNDEWTAYASTLHDFDANSGVVFFVTGGEEAFLAGLEGRLPRFPQGKKGVRVVYTGGYSSIPADLSQACIELVAKIRGGNAAQRSARASGLQSESLGYESRTWGQMNAAEQFDWLTNHVGTYRRVAI